MKQVKQNGAVTMGYRYNAKGERVAAINGDTGPVTTYTLYDEAGHWVGDYDSAGATLQQAIWMDDASVGLLSGTGTAQSLKYVEPDHLGTPRAVIDPARNVAIWTWDAKNEAFGNSPPNQDPDQDGTAFVFNLRFPGQRHDPDTGLKYNYLRDYDSDTGRYVQSDPIGLSGGLSTYSYASLNPNGIIDPLGLAAEVIWFSYDPMNNTTFYSGASRYVSPPGTFTIAAHGLLGSNKIQDASKNNLDAAQVWNRIKADYIKGKYKKIRVAACEAGRDHNGTNFVKELARVSGQPTEGTRYWVGYPEDGKIWIGTPIPGDAHKAQRLNGAQWEPYAPPATPKP